MEGHYIFHNNKLYIIQMSHEKSCTLTNLQEFKDRIRLGSVVIPKENYPFASFLIGYFIGRANLNIEDIFEFVQNMDSLQKVNLISQDEIQKLLQLLQKYPRDIRRITSLIQTVKDRGTGDISKWISLYPQVDGILQKHSNGHERKVEIAFDGTLELQNSSNTEELYEIAEENRRRIQDQDIQIARKMQEEFNRQQKNIAQLDDDAPCEICYAGLYDEQFQALDKCGHLFHKNCLVQTFKTNISSNNFPIRCPNDECKVEVGESDIKNILGKILFQKYQDHTLKAYADMNGDSISWCPTPSCGYMFFFEKEDGQRFECLECKKQYCLNCRVQWHKEMTCKEYKVSATTSQQDKQFIAFVKGKKFKQCPKCKFWVQKNQGCDHMTCKCKFQFCYKCGGIYMKCECMEQMKRQAEIRRVRYEQARKRKQQRKKKIQAEIKVKQPARSTRRKK